MKTNLFILLALLAVCAVVGAQFLNSGNSTPKAALVVELQPQDFDGEKVALTPEIQDETVSVLKQRLPEGAHLVKDGVNRIGIELPSDDEVARAKKFLERQGKLEFRESVYNEDTGEVDWQTRLDGSAVERAQALLDDRSPTGSWMISFTLTEAGTAEFAEVTERLIGKPLGIFFDGEQISAPIIQEPITGGMGQISGSFNQEDATELATCMSSGALPVKLELVESRSATSE